MPVLSGFLEGTELQQVEVKIGVLKNLVMEIVLQELLEVAVPQQELVTLRIQLVWQRL